MEKTQVQVDNQSFIHSLSEILDKIQIYWGAFLALIIIIAIIVCVIKFNNKMNKRTLQIIKSFKKNGKYIENLFVELSNSKEIIRYFINGKRWKNRIKRNFNVLYSNYYGSLLKKATLDKSINFHLKPLCTFKKIYKTVNFHSEFVTNFKYDFDGFDHSLEESLWLIDVSRYSYERKLKELKQYCDAAYAKFVLITGSAGNGKTNLLCNIAQLIMKSKHPCIFINARDVQEGLHEYFSKILNLPKIISSKQSIFMYIINLLLLLSNKRLFIIIDALNENDNDIFCSTISEFANEMFKLSRVKLLFTCRSEYFIQRYKRLFEDKLVYEPMIFDIKESNYNERAIKKIYKTYKNYFNYTGMIPSRTFYRLSNSLLLMRMFFEVYKDKSEPVISLNKFKIYKTYIGQLTTQNTNISLSEILDRIVSIMIDKRVFDDVPFNELGLSSDDLTLLKKVADENLLFTRVIKQYEGTIAEQTKEVIFFVFDELRDYCIAKHLISYALNNNDKEYTRFFELIEYLDLNKQSPLEGVLRYAYNFFKSEGQYEMCVKILHIYDPEKNRQPFHGRLGDESNNIFYDFGLNLILDSDMDICDFEKRYLFEKLKYRNCFDVANVFWYLLQNSMYEIKPDFSLFVEFLLGEQKFSVIKMVLSKLKYGKEDEETGEKQYVIDICDTLEQWKENVGIPSVFYEFLIIFYAVFPNEYYIEDYLEEYESIGDTISEVCKLCSSEDLKNHIREIIPIIRDEDTQESVKKRLEVLLDGLEF